MVLSLSARGLTHGDISAHLAEVYGAEVSKTTISTISTITDRVIEGMTEMAEPAIGPGVSGDLSLTASTSKSATGRWRTGPSTLPWL